MSRLYLVEQNALVIGGHYHAYSQTVARAARAAGLEVTILHNRRFTGDWGVDGALSVPAFEHTWGEADRYWIREWKGGNIAHDYRSAVALLPPKAGDHVLFHTLGYSEFEQFLEYLCQLPAGGDYPSFHLLLRYDPDILCALLGTFTPLFDRISASPMLRRHVFFHSDTNLLSADFAALSGLPFTTLPIPFQQGHLRKRLSEGRRPSAPLVISYLGDARAEKNFVDLPGAVTYLWADYLKPGRARFAIQSNFNTPGGEPGVLQAAQKLGQFPTDKVETIPHALDGAAYYDRVAAADIIVIPYDPVRYKGRSSGILIEALAAGKPVVTTSGSWMATQVTNEHAVLYEGGAQLGPALKRAIDEFPTLKTGADRIAAGMMERSSGDAFVRELLATKRKVSVARSDTPRVLIVIDGDTLVQRNGAGLTALTQLRYLRDAGYRVCGVFLMNKRDWDVEGVEAWTRQLHDRIAEFDLDASFLVGTGRLSFDVLRQKSVRSEDRNSIAGDLEQTKSFDVSLELVKYFIKTKFDLVWLNYVMNAPILELLGVRDVPVICETHDIQSFQKAIYDRRPVDPLEVDTEIALLRQFQHLVSVSAAETDYLLSRLPDASITTTGIFPPLPEPAARMLAGPKNLGELVSICSPSNRDLDWETAWRNSRVDELLRFIDTPALDIFYVSSNHLSNVSGLRWFLDEIYLPSLAPAGVSMFIAGSISEAAEWPESPRLFFLGRLANLAPLYAAAKIVVLPVLEGAGVAVKTYEALGYGKPIVASSLALRGIDAAVPGIAVADDAAGFLREIVDLLGSDSLRASRGQAVRVSADKLADPARYSELLNTAFGQLLDGRAKLVHRQISSSAATSLHLEWNERVMRCNRLIRNWLESEPFEDASLKYLSEQPKKDVEMVLRALCHALLDERNAAILATRGNLRSAIAMLGDRAAERAAATLLTAIAMYAPDRGGKHGGHAFDILFDRILPLDVRVLTTEDHDQIPNFEMTGEASPFRREDGLYVASLAAPPSGGSTVEVARLSMPLAATVDWVAVQRASLDGRAQRAGSPVTTVREGSAVGIALSSGLTFLLRLPTLLTPAPTEWWVDLIADQGLLLDVREAGVSLPVELILQAEVDVLRVRLKPVRPGIHLFERVLTITVLAGSGMLTGLVSQVMSSRSVDRSILLGATSGILGEAASQGGRAADLRIRDQLITVMQEGRAPPRARVSALRQRLLAEVDLEDGPEAINSLSETGSPDQILSVLQLFDSARLIAREQLTYIGSRALTVEIQCDFESADDAEGSICLVDGQEAKLVNGQQLSRSWIIEGDRSRDAMSWAHIVAIRRKSGSQLPLPSSRLVFNLLVGRDQITDDYCCSLSNVYAVEADDNRKWVWTGPQAVSILALPLALTSPGSLRIGFSSIGANQEADALQFTLNGMRLEHSIREEDDELVVEAAFTADAESMASTELAISVKEHFLPDGDPRVLGVCINYIKFIIPF